MKLEDKLKTSWRKYLNEKAGDTSAEPRPLSRYVQSHPDDPLTIPAENLQKAYNRLYALWQAMSRNPAQKEIAAEMVEPINELVAAHNKLIEPR